MQKIVMGRDLRNGLFAWTFCIATGWGLAAAPSSPSAKEKMASSGLLSDAGKADVVVKGERYGTWEIRPSDGGDWIAQQPGLECGRMGGHGLEPVLRGQQQERIQVLLDGAPLYGGCPNRMDPPSSYASPALYDQITVQAPGTTLERATGPAGTIFMERQTPRLEEGVWGKAQLGSRYSSAGDLAEGWADGVAGTTEGFARAGGSWASAGDYQDGNGESVRSSYDTGSAMGSLGWTPSDRSRVELSSGYSTTTDATYAGAAMDAPLSDAFMESLHATFRPDDSDAPFQELRLDAGWNEVTHEMDNYSLRERTAPAFMRAPSRSTTLSGAIAADIQTGPMLWTVGTDTSFNKRMATRYSGTRSDAVTTSQSVLWPDVETDRIGFFLQDKISLTSQTSFTLGVRYDRVHASASDSGVDPDAANTFSPDALYRMTYGQGFRPTTENLYGALARIEHQLGEGLPVLHASLSRLMRSPDPTERAIASNGAATDRWVGNPLLQPETHQVFEAGALWEHHGWKGSATIWMDQVTDFIFRDRARGQDGILVNNLSTVYRNTDARLWGSSAQLEKSWTKEWSSSIAYTFTEGERSEGGSALPQIPPLDLRLHTAYSPAPWSFASSLRICDRQDRVDSDPRNGSGLDVGRTAGFLKWDIQAAWQINRHLRWSAGIDNLLSETYAEHLNRANAFDPTSTQINEPGRTFWTSLTARF